MIDYEKSLLTDEYSRVIQETIFLSVFTEIIDYINEESDKEMNQNNDTGELFSSLQQMEQRNQSRCIKLLTQFSFDMLVHIIEEYIDPNWIYQDSSSISSKLGKQKEREKQTIIELSM